MLEPLFNAGSVFRFDTCAAIILRRAVTLDKNFEELNGHRDVVKKWKQSRVSF